MDQQQEQKKSGSVLNDLQGASSNLRIGRFLISQGAKLLSGMGGPVLLTIGLIFLFVFVVGFAGIPGGSEGTTPQPSQPPPSITPSSELREKIKNQFGIDFDTSFDTKFLTWAWEVLSSAKASAPNFFNLIQANYSSVFIKRTQSVSNTSGNTISFSSNAITGWDEQFFKQVFIHELGHIIYGSRYSPNPDFKQRIKDAQIKEGALTSYAENSTPDPDKVCDRASGDSATRESEDFAESISYYINKNTPERSYSTQCPPVKNQTNPFFTGKYLNHLLLMKSLLGG